MGISKRRVSYSHMQRCIRLFRVIALLLCPLTLLLGHLIGVLKSFPPSIDKDGWINTYFVKKGWFWTSIVMWICVFRYGKFNRQYSARYLVLTAWWYLFTQSAWFHVAPIMDLIFVATGGLCHFDILDSNGNLNSQFHDSNSRRVRSLAKIRSFLQNFQLTVQDEIKSKLASQALAILRQLMGEVLDERSELLVSPSEINFFITNSIKSVEEIGTSAACRTAGGHWKGGHDPSGHIFLNTLMIMLLLGELDFFAPIAWSRLTGKGHRPFRYVTRSLNNNSVCDPVQRRPRTLGGRFLFMIFQSTWTCVRELTNLIAIGVRSLIWDNPVLLLIALVMLWWYSLIVTTLIFHTVSEQLTGLVCAYVVAGSLYWHTVKYNAMNQPG